MAATVPTSTGLARANSLAAARSPNEAGTLQRLPSERNARRPGDALRGHSLRGHSLSQRDDRAPVSVEPFACRHCGASRGRARPRGPRSRATALLDSLDRRMPLTSAESAACSVAMRRLHKRTHRALVLGGRSGLGALPGTRGSAVDGFLLDCVAPQRGRTTASPCSHADRQLEAINSARGHGQRDR